MTTPPDPQAQAREREVRAVEVVAVAAATRYLSQRIDSVTDVLREAFGWAITDPTRWWYARQTAAGQLAGLRPALSLAIRRNLTPAARVGARHAGGRLPTGHDPAGDPHVRDLLDRVDGDARARLARASTQVLDYRVESTAQLDRLVERVEAPQRWAEQVTGDAVARAVAGGVTAVADDLGLSRVWVSERSACLSCASMNGAVAAPGALFVPVRKYPTRLIPWFTDGLTGPPGHRACRCRVAVATPGLAEALRRETERDVAQGNSAYDSLPARLRAVDVVLRSSVLPRTVLGRAAHDRAVGRFSTRDLRALPDRPRVGAERKRTG